MATPILKSYFGKIFFEFLTHNNKCDTIIILSGFPSSNQNNELMYFFYENNNYSKDWEK